MNAPNKDKKGDEIDADKTEHKFYADGECKAIGARTFLSLSKDGTAVNI